MNTLMDLTERTFNLADSVRMFVGKLRKFPDMFEDCKQVIRSSGSIGANYIEAIESLSDKDKIYRFRIVKKEARETAYWLRLLHHRVDQSLQKECNDLINESGQIVRIFSSIVQKNTCRD